MNSVMCGLDGEQVAIEFAIPRHRLPVDIIAQVLWNRGGFLGYILHVIGEALILPKVAIIERAARLVQVAAKVVDQFPRQVRHVPR